MGMSVRADGWPGMTGITYTDPEGVTHEDVTCVGVRYPASTIVYQPTGEEYQSVQFLMRLSDGTETWTVSFPDFEDDD